MRTLAGYIAHKSRAVAEAEIHAAFGAGGLAAGGGGVRWWTMVVMICAVGRQGCEGVKEMKKMEVQERSDKEKNRGSGMEGKWQGTRRKKSWS